MSLKPTQKTAAQFARFLAVGAFVFAADVLLYWLLVEKFSVSIYASNLAAKLCGATLGFLLHKFVTYNWKQASGGAFQFAGYILLWFVNLGMANSILYFGVDLFELAHFPVKIFGDIVIVTSSFLIGRFFIFREKRE